MKDRYELEAQRKAALRIVSVPALLLSYAARHGISVAVARAQLLDEILHRVQEDTTPGPYEPDE